jgi:hypothetical protein
MWFTILWKWIIGRTGKIWRCRAEESLECHTEGLISDSGGSSEDQNANRNVDSRDCARKVSVGHKNSVGSWTRGHLCYILEKNLTTFCLCPETLHEAKFQGDGLVDLGFSFPGTQRLKLYSKGTVYCLSW